MFCVTKISQLNADIKNFHWFKTNCGTNQNSHKGNFTSEEHSMQ